MASWTSTRLLTPSRWVCMAVCTSAPQVSQLLHWSRAGGSAWLCAHPPLRCPSISTGQALVGLHGCLHICPSGVPVSPLVKRWWVCMAVCTSATQVSQYLHWSSASGSAWLFAHLPLRCSSVCTCGGGGGSTADAWTLSISCSQGQLGGDKHQQTSHRVPACFVIFQGLTDRAAPGNKDTHLAPRSRPS